MDEMTLKELIGEWKRTIEDIEAGRDVLAPWVENTATNRRAALEHAKRCLANLRGD